MYENFDGDTQFNAKNLSAALSNEYITEFSLTASNTDDNSQYRYAFDNMPNLVKLTISTHSSYYFDHDSFGLMFFLTVKR
jgi:hypothetical protein